MSGSEKREGGRGREKERESVIFCEDPDFCPTCFLSPEANDALYYHSLNAKQVQVFLFFLFALLSAHILPLCV